jgi:hypothetical protein
MVCAYQVGSIGEIAMIKVIMAAVMMICLAGHAFAGEVEDLAAYYPGNYTEMAGDMRHYEPLAEGGDAIAQYKLGVCMDAVNNRFGSMVVTFGSLLPGKANAGSHVIPPSWRPDGIKNVKCT